MSEPIRDGAEGPKLEVWVTGVSGKEVVDGTKLEAIVDEDLKGFSRFYCKVVGNAELSDFERAAIKTYLWWKTHDENNVANPQR